MNISFPHEVIGLKPHKVMEGIALSSSDGTKTKGNLDSVVVLQYVEYLYNYIDCMTGKVRS